MGNTSLEKIPEKGYDMKGLFFKGVQLADRQTPTEHIITPWTPTRAVVPLLPREVGVVPVGTVVKKGTLLGEEGGFAPENGVVTEYREIAHPLMGKVLCAVMELCPHDETEDPEKYALQGAHNREDILQAVRQAGIINEATGEYLWKELQQWDESLLEYVAVDLLEDDPLCGAGAALFVSDREKVLRGMEYLGDVLPEISRKIVWNSRWMEENQEGIPKKYGLRLKKRYPAWVLHQQESGACAVRIGVQALAALVEAVEEGKSQTHTIVTVAGEMLTDPGMYLVPIGTPIGELLEHCGAGARPCQVVMGPALTGQAVLDQDAPVTANTQGITVWSPQKAKLDDRVFPCIGCGKCQSACPMGLEPWVVQEALGLDPVPIPMLWRVEECSQCGVCRAVCPSGIDLTACMRQAAELRKRGGLT